MNLFVRSVESSTRTLSHGCQADRRLGTLFCVLLGLSLWLPVARLYIAHAAAEEAGFEAQPLVRFCAMGDVPRSEKDFVVLKQQIAELPASSEFAIHLGDIKKGGEPCLEENYRRVAELFRTSKEPVFLVPGDNEWNDCESPDEAWKHWVRHFLGFEKNWDHSYVVRRQQVRQENFAFLQNGVLFVGVNLVGGRVHDENEWKVRQQQDVVWLTEMIRDHGTEAKSVIVLAQAALSPKNEIFFNGLSEQARRFERPVLYLHGDGHRWISDRPFNERNIYRVQVDAGGFAPPLFVTVTDDPVKPFNFDRRLDAD